LYKSFFIHADTIYVLWFVEHCASNSRSWVWLPGNAWTYLECNAHHFG